MPPALSCGQVMPLWLNQVHFPNEFSLSLGSRHSVVGGWQSEAGAVLALGLQLSSKSLLTCTHQTFNPQHPPLQFLDLHYPIWQSLDTCGYLNVNVIKIKNSVLHLSRHTSNGQKL